MNRESDSLPNLLSATGGAMVILTLLLGSLALQRSFIAHQQYSRFAPSGVYEPLAPVAP